MEEPSLKRHGRKRKKSFIQNAKKFGKKGFYGRGSQLEADLYNYLVEIVSHFKKIENEEEKHIFANNVFKQMENQEETCCYNQVGCRVIETLLPFASESTIDKFIGILSKDLRKPCNDTFASHVVEAIFLYCNGIDSTYKQLEFSIKIAKFLLNNLEEFVWNIYSNYTIRKVLQTFSKLEGKNTNTSVKNSDKLSPSEDDICEEHQEIVKSFARRILSWPQFLDLPYNDSTSGLLQVIVQAIAKLDPKLFQSYFDKLIDDCFVIEFNMNHDNIEMNELFPTPVVALMEIFIQNATPKMFTQIYAKCFFSKLAFLTTDRNSNFAVQKLLDNCKEKTEFEAIFDELVEHFEDISKKNHTRTILALGNGCKRLSAKQGSYMMALLKLFDCLEPQERQDMLVLCLSNWKKYEKVAEMIKIKEKSENLDTHKLHFHGTLIVQILLNFNKPIKVVNSILSLETDQLKRLLCDTNGSHIADSFVKSTFVGEKSREKLIRKMQGTYQKLVSSKYGSRSFDALWDVASLKMKMVIMEELVQKDGIWSNNQFGKIIANKINLNLFKRNKEEWKDAINKNENKNLLANIFE